MIKNKFIKILILFFIIIFIFAILNILTCCNYEEKEFEYKNNQVQIIFKGEVSNYQIFGKNKSITDFVSPVDKFNNFEGEYFNQKPNWLKFKYKINNTEKIVLIAKEPILNFVSWDALARGGLVFGDDSVVDVGGVGFVQGGRVFGVDGSVYVVRLLDCGGYTMDNLSEWNLLIGGVHEGDVDFNGKNFGWIKNTYSNNDLKLGFDGSLNWCKNNWLKEDYKVNRGYFFVSRFHATKSSFVGERIYWRPVLELIKDENFNELIINDYIETKIQKDKNKTINFLGEISNEKIFGKKKSIIDIFYIDEGILQNEKPNWLKFKLDDKEILVAKEPILRSVSWDALARGGLVFGDDSVVDVGGVGFVQGGRVFGVDGSVYVVRLLDCGGYTMDNLSEWNLLIGGVHEGDGDFNGFKWDGFSWIETPYNDKELQIGLEGFGTATWCSGTKKINDELYAVNRGYFTVSRFHLTETSFKGNAFAWRPVLEKIN